MTTIRCPLCFQEFQMLSKRDKFPCHQYKEYHCPLSGQGVPRNIFKWAKKFFPDSGDDALFNQCLEWAFGLKSSRIDLDEFFRQWELRVTELRKYEFFDGRKWFPVKKLAEMFGFDPDFYQIKIEGEYLVLSQNEVNTTFRTSYWRRVQ